MPSDGRRAEAAHVLSGARAAARRAGATTTRSTAGRPTASAILFRSHARRRGRCRSRGSTPCAAAGGPAEPLPMPEAGAGDLLAGRQADRLLAALRATSAPEKRYGGGQANDLYIFDLARPRRDADHRPPARRARPDVDRRHDLLQLRSRRHVQSLRLRRRERRRRRRSRSDDVGRALAERRRPGGRIVYESDGELQVLDTKTGKARGDRDHGARRRPGAAAQPRPGRHAGPRRRAEPEGRARAVRGARRHLHRADREGADAQPDALVGGARQVAALVAGRPAHRLHLRHDAARKSCTSSRRTAPASRSSSRRAARRCATRRSGRRTASGSRSATRTASVYVVTVADRKMTQIADARARPDPRLRLVAARASPGVHA